MDLLYNYWLSSVGGISVKKIRSILECMGGAREAWNSSLYDLKGVPGLREGDPERLLQRRDGDVLRSEINAIEKRGMRVVSIDADEYPENLKNIYDPPLVLYMRGNIRKCVRNVAVVGSRRCSRYGRLAAESIAKKLAMLGIGIISGLARGIDTEAHRGALDGDGYTCAVLGCGCDVVYPPENRTLMREIESRGAIISEYRPGTEPFSFNFPPRNRIISGISDGVLVIEAGEKSGALITASFGLEQGRDIFAVPGSIFESYSKGSNRLIKDGAAPVTCAEDVLNALGLEFKEMACESAGENLSPAERTVWNIISDSPIYIDELTYKTSMKIGELNSLLTSMELKGSIKILPGKYIVRAF